MTDRVRDVEDRLIAIKAMVEEAHDRDDECAVMELENEAAHLSEEKMRLMVVRDIDNDNDRDRAWLALQRSS